MYLSTGTCDVMFGRLAFIGCGPRCSYISWPVVVRCKAGSVHQYSHSPVR